MRITGIVLAAGRSERAGFPKALAVLDGRTFVERIRDALLEGGVSDVIVVVGAPHGDRVASVAGCACAENPDPERGMLSSVQAGIEAARRLAPPPSALVLALVDHPRIAPRTVQTLLETWRSGAAEVVRPRHRGRTGHPIVVGDGAIDALAEASLDVTPRDVLSMRRRLDVEVPDSTVLDDLDTAEAIRQAGGLPPS
ncbi:MAG: nucleotidyltransferase family protein [Myxococcales bacterium]|nr:nucleotidyltransferase family protein [Myxococcales bacterium]MCB9580105.1 nucleotidyltransferase family protein [Polyangiaceae bacterium]